MHKTVHKHVGKKILEPINMFFISPFQNPYYI